MMNYNVDLLSSPEKTSVIFSGQIQGPTISLGGWICAKLWSFIHFMLFSVEQQGIKHIYESGFL